MSKVIYFTNGMASTLNSSFELSRRLVESGHDVTYCSHLDLSAAVELQGYRFRHLQACQQIKDQLYERLANLGRPRSFGQWMKAFRIRLEQRQQSLVTTEIEDLIDEIKPDLLVIDIEMHYVVLATMPLRIPTVLPIVWFSIFRRANLPPMHTLLLPPTSIWRRLRVEVAWWKLLLARAWRQWVSAWHPKRLKGRFVPVDYGSNRRSDLQAVAQARGIEFAKVTDWTQWLQPHLYPHLKVLSFNVWEMEFPHQPPSNMAYVGPMIDRQREEPHVSEVDQNAWESFREACQQQRRPIFYCSLGTFWSADESFLRKVIEIFQRRRDWAMVLGLGGKLKPEQLQPLPDNVLAMEYAPQLEILKAASVAVTHGGITTINECIYFEVPLLVCSTGHVDQDGCAARVHYHRLGVMADIRRDTSQVLESRLQTVLHDERIKSNVQDMKAVFLRYEEDRIALKTMEHLMRAPVNASSHNRQQPYHSTPADKRNRR